MAGVVALVALACLLAGCGAGDVAVPRFSVTPAGHRACPALMAALPAHVSDQPHRRVAGSTYAAAWGDPAIVLRCGVPPLRGNARSAPCLTRNGIGWFVPPAQIDDLGRNVVMTLAVRSPAVRVVVPAHYRPNGPSNAMADLDATIRAHTTVTGHCR